VAITLVSVLWQKLDGFRQRNGAQALCRCFRGMT